MKYSERELKTILNKYFINGGAFAQEIMLELFISGYKVIPHRQPISTAPKDGTRIILFFPASRDPKDGHISIEGQWDDNKDGIFDEPCWFVQNIDSMVNIYKSDPQPEFWMPLTYAN